MTLRPTDLPSPLYALTWWQPWAWAMFHGKAVENRPWPAPDRHRGTVIAIHAGLRYDKDGKSTVLALSGKWPPGEQEITRGAIVGVARLKTSLAWREHPPVIPRPPKIAECGCSGIHKATCPYRSPWFFGPYGWLFEDAMEFAEPIPCRGAQGLWRVGEYETRCARFEAERANPEPAP